MTTEQQLIQELAALRHTVDALVQAMRPWLTRDEMCARRGCHRNTLTKLIKLGVVPKPDATGKFLRAEVVEFEVMERQQRMAA